ncbi:succinylglutamate desuccinylase/aspartoacylase family protein [Shewanella submarina]|uniref:Succinylglutamate desuccinylase/aspartoacylase family protein n=2 Tax=Shewanella submarina TaxID=2016376 RepID=A0ABV7G7Q8_9GAMM|nr:succinylglutamate desuccinylase/aspartoacylase family protein [Shewanella submarina]MCL1037269.1 succinylglutamate desuccinylase/aspartoacylase family protein [Shewanella submarina]
MSSPIGCRVCTEFMTEPVFHWLKSSPTGPLMVLTGFVHGNEPVGHYVLEQLKECIAGLPTKGSWLFVEGNKQAFLQGKRFIDRDLNRCFTPEILLEETIYGHEPELARAINNKLSAILDEYEDREIHLLDLHSTSAHGMPFMSALTRNTAELLLPVTPVPKISGLLEQLQGCLAEWFVPELTTSHIIECGQHDQASTLEYGLNAVILHSHILGMMAHCEQVESAKAYLAKASAPWGKIYTEICYTLTVSKGDEFSMYPGFENGQPIHREQPLATLNGREICAHLDGRIIMPGYHLPVSEGFFLSQDKPRQ